jgi:hypothetical protein
MAAPYFSLFKLIRSTKRGYILYKYQHKVRLIYSYMEFDIEIFQQQKESQIIWLPILFIV